ncbi:uncharacterized protein LOC119606657 isoform X2 [Lucilia sericata]|uniref:uncharacterized protein LOC119606657 isoform X2 n=1 Tax=Lucilia sericata TaxID=13632 RepID=UPI0018A7EF5D|nr:uncharacterized protein LOC119606657 isoform X2 [Lucilia sericata]
MSKELLQNDTNDTKLCGNDEIDLVNFELQQTIASPIGPISNGLHDKQQSLVEKANNTFQELCKTLENEQTKLLELEERRKKLQEEMLLLKAEIEEEKKSFNLNIVQSVAENLSALNKSSANDDKDCKQKLEMDENGKFKNLYTCYEDEEPLQVTARNIAAKNTTEYLQEETTIQEHVQYIRSELQNVLTECISEQYDK